MNLIPKLAEMLGVEIGEEFFLKANFPNSGDITIRSPYRFRERLEHKNLKGEWEISKYALEQLILGNFEIIKLPFKPKVRENYYCIKWFGNGSKGFFIVPCVWYGDFFDYALMHCGNVFRTEKEAEAHKYEIYEKLTGRKWESEME